MRPVALHPAAVRAPTPPPAGHRTESSPAFYSPTSAEPLQLGPKSACGSKSGNPYRGRFAPRDCRSPDRGDCPAPRLTDSQRGGWGKDSKAGQRLGRTFWSALTLDRYDHLYGSDVEAVGVAMNALLPQECWQDVGTDAA